MRFPLCHIVVSVPTSGVARISLVPFIPFFPMPSSWGSRQGRWGPPNLARIRLTSCDLRHVYNQFMLTTTLILLINIQDACHSGEGWLQLQLHICPSVVATAHVLSPTLERDPKGNHGGMRCCGSNVHSYVDSLSAYQLGYPPSTRRDIR